jgi:hypothetical protein
MKKKVLVLAEAASDIERGIDFYNAIEDGVGMYFRDSIIADIRRLGIYPKKENGIIAKARQVAYYQRHGCYGAADLS